MKRLLLILGLSVFGLGAAAQPQVQSADQMGGKILEDLSAKIAGLGDYRVEFRADAEGSEVEGAYAVSGRKFRITTEEFEVIGDGEARYEVNHGLQEVVIDNMDTTDINILSNPTRAFEFVAGGFTPSYGGTATVGGSECDVVNLVPTFDEAAIAQIKLYVSRSTGLPVKISYGIEGLDGDIDVQIVKFEGGAKYRIPSLISIDRN